MLKTLFRPWTLTLIISILYVSWILSLGHGDPLVFVEIGTRFAEGDPNGTEGYDGQFFYYIATDPAHAPAKIDVPAYRFQRILYPLLARWLAFGQSALIPWALLSLNLVSLVGGVWLMEQLLAQQRVSSWYALPAGLYAGQLLALRVNLPEPLALTLMLLGIWLFTKWERQKSGTAEAGVLGRLAWVWSAVCLMLAVLTKETMLITGLAYVLYLLSQKEVKKALIFGAIFIIPFSLYQLYLYLWLGSFGVGSGGAGATPFSLIPLGGLLEVTRISWAAFWLFLIILGPIVIWPDLWALWATGRDILAQKWHPWTLALALNALIILFLPSSTFREPLAMLRFTVPLVALIILYSAYTKRWRALNYSFFWLFTLIFMVRDKLL